MPDHEDMTAGGKRNWKKSPSVVQYARCASKCYHLGNLYQKRTERVLSNTTWSVSSVLSPFFERNWYFVHITVPPTMSNLSNLFHCLLTHQLISALNHGCSFFLPQLCLIEKTKASFISLNRAVTNKSVRTKEGFAKTQELQVEINRKSGTREMGENTFGKKGMLCYLAELYLSVWMYGKEGEKNVNLSALSPSYFYV